MPVNTRNEELKTNHEKNKKCAVCFSANDGCLAAGVGAKSRVSVFNALVLR